MKGMRQLFSDFNLVCLALLEKSLNTMCSYEGLALK